MDFCSQHWMWILNRDYDKNLLDSKMFQNFVSDHRMLIGRKKRQCLCFLQPVEVDQKEETENTSKLEDEIFI